MNLSLAITNATSIADCNAIFANEINVKLGWTSDQVTIEGYEGCVTTDFIAHHVFYDLDHNDARGDSKLLAEFLATKVFRPLKKLVESSENRHSLYQLVALARIGWTPPPSSEFGGLTALKHAMVLGVLDQKYSGFYDASNQDLDRQRAGELV